jgi:hypothetical protein
VANRGGGPVGAGVAGPVPRLRDETEVLLGCVMACATWRAGAFFRGPTPTELKMKKYTREGGCCGSLAANQPGRGGGGGGGGCSGLDKKYGRPFQNPKNKAALQQLD